MENDAVHNTYPAIQTWHDKGRFTQLLGHSIFYIDEGDKDLPVLLLIHGFPTSSYDWKGVWQVLRSQFRIVCLDMLGFGFSDKPNARNYTIHGQADIVEALVEALDLKEFHVLAHDYGDTVAQELLSRQSERHRQRSLVISVLFKRGPVSGNPQGHLDPEAAFKPNWSDAKQAIWEKTI